jgi:hypothetical protein
MNQPIPVSDVLHKLAKLANIEIAETRRLHDETTVHILVGRLPIFPHGSKPTWYPLIVRKGQTQVEPKEIEAILRHFWQYQLKLQQATVDPSKHRHTKSVLKKQV